MADVVSINRDFIDEEEWIIARFHRADSLLKGVQDIASLPSETPIIDAVQLLLDEDLQQISVDAGPEILGVLSLRSFAQGVLRDGLGRDAKLLERATVSDFLERPTYVRPSEDLVEVIARFDSDTDLLIGDENSLEGVVSIRDALHYLDKIARPYILIQEIELGLRQLIQQALSDAELIESIKRSLGSKFKNNPSSLPQRLADLTFGDLATVSTNSVTFEAHLKMILGPSRDVFRSQIDPVVELRNEAFHFRRLLTTAELAHLKRARDWIHLRVRRASLAEHGLAIVPNAAR